MPVVVIKEGCLARAGEALKTVCCQTEAFLPLEWEGMERALRQYNPLLLLAWVNPFWSQTYLLLMTISCPVSGSMSHTLANINWIWFFRFRDEETGADNLGYLPKPQSWCKRLDFFREEDRSWVGEKKKTVVYLWGGKLNNLISIVSPTRRDWDSHYKNT